MEIRKAKIEDVEEMLAIYNDEIVHGVATFDIQEKTVEEWKQWFLAHQGSKVILVCEIENHIAGYASLSEYNHKEAFSLTHELSIYVNKKDRHQHVASCLMEKIIEIAKEKNVHTIVSLITQGNEVSIHLHEKFGFTYCGTIKEVGFKFSQYLGIDFYQLILMQHK